MTAQSKAKIDILEWYNQTYPPELLGVRLSEKSGYQGVPCRGFDTTIKGGAGDHPTSIRDELRNLRTSRKRAPGERPFAVIRCVFGSGHVLVTTVGLVCE